VVVRRDAGWKEDEVTASTGIDDLAQVSPPG
jgi:hypothetical protein